MREGSGKAESFHCIPVTQIHFTKEKIKKGAAFLVHSCFCRSPRLLLEVKQMPCGLPACMVMQDLLCKLPSTASILLCELNLHMSCLILILVQAIGNVSPKVLTCDKPHCFQVQKKGMNSFVSLCLDKRCTFWWMNTFSGKSSFPSGMISLRYFTGATVCHKLVSTSRAGGMNSPVTHILTPCKTLIVLPGTSCEPIYLAGSRKYQTALCFPFLQCPGNLCFWNFLWMLTAPIMHQQQRHVATRPQSCQKQRDSH